MTCPHCGRTLAEDAKFCDACGKSLTPPTPKEEKLQKLDKKKRARQNRRKVLHFLRGMTMGLLLANLIVAVANSDAGKLAMSALKAKKAVKDVLKQLKK